MSSRVQIAFDLDTNKLKEIYCPATKKDYTSAYYDIKAYMQTKGYEHRQGSVYHSIKPKSRVKVLRDIYRFQKENPWFSECVSKLDYGELPQMHDLLPDIQKDLFKEKSPDMEIDQEKTGEEILQEMFREHRKNHPVPKDNCLDRERVKPLGVICDP